jgi:hypothetical protein
VDHPEPAVPDDQRRDGLHPGRCIIGLIAEGLFEERGSEDFIAVTAQARATALARAKANGSFLLAAGKPVNLLYGE